MNDGDMQIHIHLPPNLIRQVRNHLRSEQDLWNDRISCSAYIESLLWRDLAAKGVVADGH